MNRNKTMGAEPNCDLNSSTVIGRKLFAQNAIMTSYYRSALQRSREGRSTHTCTHPIWTKFCVAPVQELAVFVLVCVYLKL